MKNKITITFLFLLSSIFTFSQNCILELSSGQMSTYAIDCDSNLLRWKNTICGNNEKSFENTNNLFFSKSTINKFKKISTTNCNVLAIANDGSLWGWGDNYYYVLGLGNNERIFEMQRIGSDNDWADVKVNVNYSVAIKEDGTLWSMGENVLFTAYHDIKYFKEPKKINSAKWKYINISYGNDKNMFSVKDDGTLWFWQPYNSMLTEQIKEKQIGNEKGWSIVLDGFNSFGHLAIKNNQLYLIKAKEVLINNGVDVKKVNFNLKIKDISKGLGSLYYIIDENGSLWGMGDNSNGGLGIDNNKINNKYYDKPVLIDSTIKWKKVFSVLGACTVITDTDNKLYYVGSINDIPHNIPEVKKEDMFKPILIENK